MADATNLHDWRSVELRDIAVLYGGGTPNRKRTDFWSGGIPWISSADIDAGEILEISRARENITRLATQSSATKLVDAQTVLITSRVSVGKVAIASVPLCFSQDITAVEVVDKQVVLPEYLAYFLYASRPRILRFNRGTTISGIRRMDLLRLRVPVPTLPEQREIVRILRQVDNLRRWRAEANQKISRLLSNVLYDSILKQLRGKKNVRSKKISELTELVTSGSRGWGKYYAQEGARFIRVQDVQDGNLIDTDLAYVNPPESPDKERSRVYPQDILVTITGSVGRVALVSNDVEEAYVSQHVAIVRPNDHLPAWYIAAYLNHPIGGQVDFVKLNYGQAKPGLSLRQILSIRIPIPSDETLQSFEEQLNIIQPTVQQAAQATREIQKLSESILIRAFSGTLTQYFRDANQTLLAQAAKERLQLLTNPQLIDEHQSQTNKVPRGKVLSALDETQLELLNGVETAEAYATLDTLQNDSPLPPNQVKRNLDLLAQVGLLKAVSVPAAPGEIGHVYYTTAFRPLQLDDDVLDADKAALEAQLQTLR